MSLLKHIKVKNLLHNLEHGKDALKKSSSGNVDVNLSSVDKALHASRAKESSTIDSYDKISVNVLENAAKMSSNDVAFDHVYTGRAIESSNDFLDKKPHKPMHAKKSKSNNKNTSKNNRFVIASILTLIFVLFFCIGSFLVHNNLVTSNKKSYSVKVVFDAISSCDDVLIKLDSFLSSGIEQNKIENLNFKLEDLEHTKVQLNEIESKLNNIMLNENLSNEDLVYANYAKKSISARLSMIENGIEIYNNSLDTISCINYTQSFWDTVLKADNLLKESDSLIMSDNQSDKLKASSNSEQAISMLTQALSEAEKLSNKSFKVDFYPYISYIQTRLESAIHGKNSCDAIISEDLTLAVSENLLYTQKSNEASIIAGTLETTPVQVIRTNYDLEIKTIVDKYKQARKDAANYDAYVRNYLDEE